MSEENPLVIDFVMKKTLEVTRYITIKADTLSKINEILWKQLDKTKGGDGTQKEWLEGVIEDSDTRYVPKQLSSEWHMESEYINRKLTDEAKEEG